MNPQKPTHACVACSHASPTMCSLNRTGFPFVGDWCAAFDPLPDPHGAVKTPESQPSEPVEVRDGRW